MLTQYKNINEILNSKKGISANRLPDIENSLTSLRYQATTDSLNLSTNFIKEFHVYSGKSWITGNHAIQSGIHFLPNNTVIDQLPYFSINTLNLFKDLKLTAGNYRILFNFFKNLIGSYESQYLVIDEISPDRTEVKLKLISSLNDAVNQTSKQQLIKFSETVNQTTIPSDNKTKPYTSYLLNFSRNQCFTFVNSVVVNNFLYVKLLDPLPENILIDYKCWVVEEIKPPYIDRVNILPKNIVKSIKPWSSPNFEAFTIRNVTADTGYKTWSDLLSSSAPTSQQLIDSYFSGSLAGMHLNIDFRDFNNFVFYSSAAERVANFRYKIQLLEQYTAQSASIALITNSTVATTNALDIQTKRDNLISGFDAFENYLYYETGSRLTTYNIPLESANVADVTGSYISPIPKISSTNYSVSSSQFTSWYNALYATASLYDVKNLNALRNTVPLHIQNSDNSINVRLFADMLGHHFDILYTYINHMSKIHKRDENPKTGMPNELLYSVAQQFGWNLADGRQSDDLWKYVFGLDTNGAPVTGSNSVMNESIGGKDLTYATWRRIVNNLPLLLKTKGTKRSIYALMSCYGIPKSIISINEYGGPRGEGRIPIHERPVANFALDLINNVSGSVVVNVNQPINAVELRVKTDDVSTNPLLPNTMTLYTIGDNVVTLDHSSGNMGSIQINGSSSADIELFDGGWLNTLLRTSDDKLEVIAKKSKFGKIVAAVSASVTASFIANTTLQLGVAVSGSRLQGQLQELRLWTSSLANEPFNNHVNAPSAYNGNTDAHYEIVFRLPLTEKVNHATTSSLAGVQFLKTGISASFTSSWTNASPYDLIEETYYNQSIALGGSIYDDNKVRIENSLLPDNMLDVNIKKSISEYDEASLDNKKLGVYFSPQTVIDEDIMNYFGYIDLNDFVGDPGPTEKRSYPKLKQQAAKFWKQYTDKTNINEFIKLFAWFDLSFFNQLEQLLPARADKVTGVLIHPTLLERNKDTVLNDEIAVDVDYTLNDGVPVQWAVDIRKIARDSEININNDDMAIPKPVKPVSNINDAPAQLNKLSLTRNIKPQQHTQNAAQLKRVLKFDNAFENSDTTLTVLSNNIKRVGSDYKYKNAFDTIPDWAFEPVLPFIEPTSVLKSFRANRSRSIGTKLSSNGINQPNADGITPIQVNDTSGNQFRV